jgi:uncharacterized membrane protein YfcA
MYFVCIWGVFALSLFLLNRRTDRRVVRFIPNYTLLSWHTPVLLLTGAVGGVFSAVAGSGIDICSFAVLTLLFRVSEKTATPTSVCLMGANTVVGGHNRCRCRNRYC